ncbi:MAG: 4-hydroxybenzoate octaprenyltransferase [Oceanococcaceae bacterium]
MWQRLTIYAELVRLDRPIGIWLLLWPTLWALWFAAEGLPPLPILGIFVLGTVLMRSAGCAINDFADRHWDGEVERTAARPLARGAIAPWEAVAVFIVLSLCALLLILPLNSLTRFLALPAAALAASYPFAKRWTHLPQAHLGLAFAWGIPMAFAAVQGQVPALAWWLMLATVLWTIVYDTFYAMVDRDDDLKVGIRSTAILFGAYDRLWTALLQVGVLGVMLGVGLATERGWAYWLGLALAGLSAARQQWRIRGRERSACLQAFKDNHHFGAAIFCGLALDYALESGLA